jgi:hypothetical protein
VTRDTEYDLISGIDDPDPLFGNGKEGSDLDEKTCRTREHSNRLIEASQMQISFWVLKFCNLKFRKKYLFNFGPYVLLLLKLNKYKFRFECLNIATSNFRKKNLFNFGPYVLLLFIYLT